MGPRSGAYRCPWWVRVFGGGVRGGYTSHGHPTDHCTLHGHRTVGSPPEVVTRLHLGIVANGCHGRVPIPHFQEIL